MATFKICVFEHQKREDGKFPVSIRVYWNKKSAYISTEYYVYSEQIYHNKRKKVFELRDTAIIGELTDRIKMYEKAKVDKLGLNIYNYSASELARFLEGLHDKKDDDIDFIAFARKYIESETEKDRNVKRIRSTINSLADYSKGFLSIHDLTSKYVVEFVEYLKTTRVIKRVDQFGKERMITKKPVSASTIKGYTTDIRTVFNQALEEYNNEEKGDIRIHHYPFKKYKVPRAPETEKRNIQDREIYRISRLPESHIHYERAILARDTFILSFILIGMNYKDMYELEKSDYKKGRFTYKRAKTRDRRADNALISIKIEPEANKYIEKYKDRTNSRYFFDFHNRYTTPEIFVSNMSIGLKRVGSVARIDAELSTYYARHSWATIARNKCKISKSDIDECLNHVNNDEKMVDVYVEKDWSMIDESNRKVMDHVFVTCNLRKDIVKSKRSKSLKIVRKCTNKKSDSFS